MSKHWLFILSLLFLALPVMAQKRRAVLLTPEQKAHKERMERMTANTQRIMFVDSMVVDKQQFLQHYRLSPEAGCVARFQDFFHTRKQPNAYIFVNELGNRCFLAQEDTDSTLNLYGRTLTVRTARIGGVKVPPGTYMAGDSAIDGFVTDSGEGGSLIVAGGATIFIVQ